jgi:hypothetical protein
MKEEKDHRNEEGTCDGCTLGEHPSDPACAWHWNKPPSGDDHANDFEGSDGGPLPPRTTHTETLDEWRAASNLHRSWEMGCPFDGEDVILTDTRTGLALHFPAPTPEAARAKAAAWVREQAKGAE